MASFETELADCLSSQYRHGDCKKTSNHIAIAKAIRLEFIGVMQHDIARKPVIQVCPWERGKKTCNVLQFLLFWFKMFKSCIFFHKSHKKVTILKHKPRISLYLQFWFFLIVRQGNKMCFFVIYGEKKSTSKCSFRDILRWKLSQTPFELGVFV